MKSYETYHQFQLNIAKPSGGIGDDDAAGNGLEKADDFRTSTHVNIQYGTIAYICSEYHIHLDMYLYTCNYLLYIIDAN